MHVADHKFDSRLNFTSEINERYEETDTALEPLSSLATWFTCNTQGGCHIQETISIHFIPLLCAGCAFGAGLESRFRTCPKTIKNITCPLPSIASRCGSRLLRFRSWVCGRHVLQQPQPYYKVSEH